MRADNTARRYRTIEIQADAHTIAGAGPLPADLHDALTTSTDVQVRNSVSQVGNTSTMNRRLRPAVSARLPKK
jgi:hypothetical protein